MFIRRWCHTT